MEIKSIAHKGLRRLIEKDVASGVPAESRVKIEAIISFLQDAADIEAVKKLPTWKPHQMTGDRKGTWSLFVTRNWRITFDVNDDNEIENLDYENYH